MFPHQLIGKLAIRTNPITYPNSQKDYSYTSSPIRIMAATESHIVYESQNMGEKHVLNNLWVDNHWTDYDQLMNLATEEHIKLMQGLSE